MALNLVACSAPEVESWVELDESVVDPCRRQISVRSRWGQETLSKHLVDLRDPHIVPSVRTAFRTVSLVFVTGRIAILTHRADPPHVLYTASAARQPATRSRLPPSMRILTAPISSPNFNPIRTDGLEATFSLRHPGEIHNGCRQTPICA
ncbi:hypothetical protein PENSPDRAFT_294924 [Peniophora sp. CONT]|nr:hypothetical protein PENSPDRAFT_294924 [Peniophora sp. CONT]